MQPDDREPSKIAVLLVNLGTPRAPKASAIRAYLREFLSDRRVIEVPRLIWWPILYLIILPLRPLKLVAAYKSIWGEKDSPIREIGEQQRQGLQQRLDQQQPGRYQVFLGMTYGQPSLAGCLAEIEAQGLEKLLVLSLYPQYSATTTGAVFDVLAKALKRVRNLPELRFVREYAQHPLYIEALAESVRAHWRSQPEPDLLLLSFHGIPKEYADKGDPYPKQCQQTTQRLAQVLGLDKQQYLQSFQSRVGRAEWLTPYTDETLKALGARQQSRVDVLCPGFATDCLETLEEIDEENREYFMQSGGQQYHYIPALNANETHLALLEQLVLEQSQGW